MDHREPVDAVKSCFHHSHTSNEGYETFQQQWLSHIAAQNPISYAEMGIQNLVFCMQFETQH